VNRIQTLPKEIANQIAAGEVVERPASVVKELVENSLDGGASHIQIDIKEGGLEWISVADNGRGIHPDDLFLAISPHATSKITCTQDLNGIKTLGFRGEALASIASVSHFELQTFSNESDAGARLLLDDSRKPMQTPFARNQGTTVIAKQLFFNTPARRKFLKSARTEALQIENMVRRLALSQFDVGFQLRIQERIVLDCLACHSEKTKQLRLHKILGKQFLDNAVFVSEQIGGLKLTGWLANESYHRSQMDHQYWYLNGRFIRDKLLIHAVREAYGDLLPAGRNPLFVLSLEIAPEAVDVNVHPTKHEVRFVEPRIVHDFIVSILRQALSQKSEVTAPPMLKSAAPLMTAKASVDYYESFFTPKMPLDLGEMLALLDQCVLVLAKNNELILVDVAKVYQLSAQSRFLSAFARGEALLQKRLLMPIELNISENEKWAALRTLGFDWREWHVGSVTLTHIPSLLKDDLNASFADRLTGWLSANEPHESLCEICAAYAEVPKWGPLKSDWSPILSMIESLPADCWNSAEGKGWTRLNPQQLQEIVLKP
jgi:DNA mismatch repair protein MutL